MSSTRALRVGSALLLTVLCVGARAAGAESPASMSPEDLQLRRIDERFERLEHEYRRLHESHVADDAARAAQAERALAELRRLRGRLRSWLARRETEPHRRNLERFLRDLEGRLGRLAEALTEPCGDTAGPDGPDTVTAPAKIGLTRPLASREQAAASGGPPANDDCSNATLVSAGSLLGDTTAASNDGAVTCGGSVAGPDVWFRYVADAAGEVVFNTFGAAFDTVLSIHTGCPGTAVNELACNDDTVGVQSELSRAMTAGEEVLVRLGGFAGDYGTFVLGIGRPAELTGVVTDAATGEGLGTARVTVYDAYGSWEQQVNASPSGAYTVSGLRAGVHFAKAHNYSYESQMYDDIPCPGSCDPTIGTPIVLALDETAQADFALHPGSAIAGRVTSEATGAPLQSVRARIYNAVGDYQGSDSSDSSGDYEIDNLAAGTYFAVAESDAGHLGELYDDIPCPVSCSPTAGTPIVVGVDSTARADFVLPLGGSISGRVTSALTGQPLYGAYVVVSDDQGGWVNSDSINPSGLFSVGGLATGSYRAVASQGNYVDQLFDGLVCNAGCDPVGGTPIPVTAGVETTGTDFALVREAAFSGIVVDAAYGVPIGRVSVQAWDDGGDWLGDGYSEDWGNYAVGGLTAGAYFATTENDAGYLDELYDDLPCEYGACSPVAGTPIAVATSMNTTGIDFALELGGSISGGVTEAAQGEPVSGRVVIWDSAGVQIDDPYIDNGQYWLGGLTAGTYFVTTDAYSLANELYDDLPCQPSCIPTNGTPVAVSLGTETPGIDFSLCGGPKVEAQFPPSHDPDSFIDGCRVQIDGLATAYHPGCEPVDRVHWSWDDGKENDSPFPAAHMYEPGHEWVTVSIDAFDTLGLGSLSATKQLHLWDCLAPDVCGYPDMRELFNLALDSTHLIQACTEIVVGPGFHMAAPAEVTIRAGRSVQLRDGVYIEGGELTVQTDPGLLP